MNRRLKALVVMVSMCLAALLLVGAALDQATPSEGVYKHLGVYTEVLHRIKSDYVEEPDLKSVTLGAINGLLQSIDPFGSYLNADQYREYVKQKDAFQGDVGLVLSWKYGYLGVVDAVPGSAADKAGLSTGDMLETIRGIATRDMPLAYAEMLLRGKPGTTVEVSLLSLSRQAPRKIALTRSVIEYPAVGHNMLPGEIGYIEASSLVTGKAQEVAAAVKGLENQGAKRLVLDLRHCATGAPEEGIAVANLFLEKGLITYLQGQRVSRQDFTADPAKTVSRLPLAVLANRGTAGGAEVAAAALLENKRAEVIGEPTYGNAALRKPVAMDDGGAIILAVAKYHSPGGKAIQDARVMPSVQVIETEPAAETEEEPGPPEPRPGVRPEDDKTLQKAIEVLTKGKAAAEPAAAPPEPARPEPRRLMTPLGEPKGPKR
ncbi:MAG: S41 family peptidase [Acidobacteriota bacterium]